MMDYKLEVITVPVRDVDQSLRFYRDSCGFTLEVDYHPTDAFRVVQLSPPGSACSMQIGVGLTDAAPGSSRNVYLVVRDIEAARGALMARGVEVEPITHKAPYHSWAGGREEGSDPERRDYASFAAFADPDGNTWILQEIGFASAETMLDVSVGRPSVDGASSSLTTPSSINTKGIPSPWA